MKLVWFRNDLRTGDHRALHAACNNSAGEGVLAVAAITPEQWSRQDEAKCRVQFWLENLRALQTQLSKLNIPLKLIQAPDNADLPERLLNLAQKYNISELLFNREYPEYERLRDERVSLLFHRNGIGCQQFDCDLVLPPGSVLNQKGDPYRVFTPFSRAWRNIYLNRLPQPLPAPGSQEILNITSDPIPEIFYDGGGADWKPELWPVGEEAAHTRLLRFIGQNLNIYPEQRDIPNNAGTSSLSPYLSIGVISTRQCLAAVSTYSDDPSWYSNQWITELIWREFYRHLLVLYPEMNRWAPFKPEVEAKISWQSNDALFEAWCQGETGFAIVDAGMKQLNQSGWMHNRVRMITASFLTKLLRQDWRLGAQYFMSRLIDGDFASNLGGWQWSASVGADAAPYFRIFNPMRQAERFDPQGLYVANWLPELKGLNAVKQHDPLFTISCDRPPPLIDYAVERRRSTELYNQT